MLGINQWSRVQPAPPLVDRQRCDGRRLAVKTAKSVSDYDAQTRGLSYALGRPQEELTELQHVQRSDHADGGLSNTRILPPAMVRM